MWNMDETGFRVGMPGNTKVVVPIHMKSAFTPSPQNHKSLTIIETVSAARNPIAPYIIIGGKRQMCYYFENGLDTSTVIDFSTTGYTNDEIVLRYLEHFVHLATEDGKHPVLLLFNCHASHRSEAWEQYAAEHNVILHCFPPHLTHIMQPLDVSVFQPYCQVQI